MRTWIVHDIRLHPIREEYSVTLERHIRKLHKAREWQMETFYFPRRNAEAQSGHRRRSGGPVEAPLRRKAETDRVRERISEGFFSAKPERVAPGDVGAAELLGFASSSTSSFAYCFFTLNDARCC